MIELCVSPGPYFTAQVDQQKTRRAKSRWSLSTFLFERQEKSIWRNTAHGRKPSWNGPRLKTQRSRGWWGRATQKASPTRPRATLAWKAPGARLKYQVDQRHTRGPQAAPQAARSLVHWAKREKRETTPQRGQPKPQPPNDPTTPEAPGAAPPPRAGYTRSRPSHGLRGRGPRKRACDRRCLRGGT